LLSKRPVWTPHRYRLNEALASKLPPTGTGLRATLRHTATLWEPPCWRGGRCRSHIFIAWSKPSPASWLPHGLSGPRDCSTLQFVGGSLLAKRPVLITHLHRLNEGLASKLLPTWTEWPARLQHTANLWEPACWRGGRCCSHVCIAWSKVSPASWLPHGLAFSARAALALEQGRAATTGA
jgi:hypothetical protein